MEPNWRIHWHLPWIWTNAGNYKRSRINHFLTFAILNIHTTESYVCNDESDFLRSQVF